MPAAVPAPTEIKHMPKNSGVIRGPTQPEQRVEESFLGLRWDNDKFTYRSSY